MLKRLRADVKYYKQERVHQGLGYLILDELYHGARGEIEKNGLKYH